MALTIPDKGEAFNDTQSILFQEYLDIIVAGLSGTTCVKTGCAVTAQATPNMTVAVAAGTIRSNGVDYTVAGGNVNIAAADASNPRLDIVVVTSAGALASRTGVAAANPKPAVLTANDVALAVVYVPANDTTIESNQITDLRVVNNNFTPGISGPFAHRNKIINGNFDIWQRGTSQTDNGYGSADRWTAYSSGTTKTLSRQAFALGQTDVPGEPTYFARIAVTSVAGAANYAEFSEAIESVRTCAGKNITVSFWAKADAAKNMSIEFRQSFGTGGAPSAAINYIGAQKVALTTVWQKFTKVIAIPSISGKTLGTNNDDYLALNFWFDGGADYNLYTDTLGQQSGTFDIAQVQIEEGSVATPFEQRPIGYELSLCQRYYEKLLVSMRWDASAASAAFVQTVSFVEKRVLPTVTIGTARAATNVNSFTLYTAVDLSTTCARAELVAAAAGDCYNLGIPITLSAEL